jgi:hypothetical protein
MTNWDSYSNQPHIIKDKNKKREICKKSLFSHLKLFFFNIFIFPFIFLAYILKLFNSKKDGDKKYIFCMSVNLENSIENEKELLKELGVKRILVRFPMWQMDRLGEYKEYVDSFSEYEVLINLMQSRTHIENHQLLKEDVKKIFKSFKSIKEFQVGTTINRKKWEFYSVDEYLKFFEVVKSVRDESFCNRVLIGSSVIDFEYHFSLRSLFNFYKVYYDRFSTLLYVDRRGSPFNTQAGFDLCKKIELLWTMVKLSPKSADVIYVTETNWPIKATAPYSPTSEKECVSLEDYADFMVAYHLIALASRKVERVYWHQLVAHGYGLYSQVENRKYPAFLAYKVMVKLLKDKRLLDFDMKSRIKWFRFEGLEVFYCEDGFEKSFVKSGDRDIFGKSFKKGRVIYR